MRHTNKNAKKEEENKERKTKIIDKILGEEDPKLQRKSKTIFRNNFKQLKQKK